MKKNLASSSCTSDILQIFKTTVQPRRAGGVLRVHILPRRSELRHCTLGLRWNKIDVFPWARSREDHSARGCVWCHCLRSRCPPAGFLTAASHCEYKRQHSEEADHSVALV